MAGCLGARVRRDTPAIFLLRSSVLLRSRGVRQAGISDCHIVR
jgi:hypothetical protein